MTDEEPRLALLDRIGTEAGSTLHAMVGGEPSSFEDRSLPVSMLDMPYSVYALQGEDLPPGWTIETQVAAPGFGREGGATEVRFVDGRGRWVPVADLLKLGLLVEVADPARPGAG